MFGEIVPKTPDLIVDLDIRTAEAFLPEDSHIGLQKSATTHLPAVLFEGDIPALVVGH